MSFLRSVVLHRQEPVKITLVQPILNDAVLLKLRLRMRFGNLSGNAPYVGQDGAVLIGRGLDGVKLIVRDKCLGMLEAVGEMMLCTVPYQRFILGLNL